MKNSTSSTTTKTRCAWATSPLLIAYHDTEWGVPVHDDQTLFELLILEGAQAGLSWETVLKKRDAYREAFLNFDPRRVAHFTKKDEKRLLENRGIIRNRLKIASAIRNAKIFLTLQQQHGSFNKYIWQFVDGDPIINHYNKLSDLPSTTPEAEQMSKALKAHGMNFVGPTICYAFMQSAGMVNDHTTDCFRYHQTVAKAQ